MSIDLDVIEGRAEAAKHVTGDDELESNLAWCANWQTTAYEVSGPDADAISHRHGLTVPYALCVAEETAELLMHAPDDIKALVAEVRRLRAELDALDVVTERDRAKAEHMRRTLRLAEGGDET